MALMCSMFGHKWKEGICSRCNKKQSGYTDKTQEEKRNEMILPTGKTFADQIGDDFKKAIEDEKRNVNPKFHRTENYDAYKVRFEKESRIDIILLEIIRNNDGISQRKLYPLIPEVPQTIIRKAVDELVKGGKIKKDKQGSSYSLWLL